MVYLSFKIFPLTDAPTPGFCLYVAAPGREEICELLNV